MTTTDREWYNKLPIADLNAKLAGTGWDIRKIYLALQIQELELKVRSSETWETMRNFHWDEQEYKELLPVHDELEKEIENIGEWCIMTRKCNDCKHAKRGEKISYYSYSYFCDLDARLMFCVQDEACEYFESRVLKKENT
jgi:hypothetical protein